MLAFAGKSERGFLRFLFFMRLALLRRVAAAAILAVRIGTKSRALGVFGLFDRLFALLHLGGERRLGCGLGVLRGLLGSANLGRVLRRGQVCQLQIRWTNRHARLFPL